MDDHPNEHMDRLDRDNTPYTVSVATVDRARHEGPVLSRSQNWLVIRIPGEADPTWIAICHIVSIRINA